MLVLQSELAFKAINPHIDCYTNQFNVFNTKQFFSFLSGNSGLILPRVLPCCFGKPRAFESSVNIFRFDTILLWPLPAILSYWESVDRIPYNNLFAISSLKPLWIYLFFVTVENILNKLSITLSEIFAS